MLKGTTVTPAPGTELWRDATEEEEAEWRASPSSRGMTDSGETKLFFPHAFRAATGEPLTVVRARVRARRGWRDVPGCVELVDAEGTHWFARRSNLEAPSA